MLYVYFKHCRRDTDDASLSNRNDCRLMSSKPLNLVQCFRKLTTIFKHLLIDTNSLTYRDFLLAWCSLSENGATPNRELIWVSIYIFIIRANNSKSFSSNCIENIELIKPSQGLNWKRESMQSLYLEMEIHIQLNLKFCIKSSPSRKIGLLVQNLLLPSIWIRFFIRLLVPFI